MPMVGNPSSFTETNLTLSQKRASGDKKIKIQRSLS